MIPVVVILSLSAVIKYGKMSNDPYHSSDITERDKELACYLYQTNISDTEFISHKLLKKATEGVHKLMPRAAVCDVIAFDDIYDNIKFITECKATYG